MIKVYDDINCLSMAAADLFTNAAQKACQERGRFSVLLAGGETPRRTYELLAQEPFRSNVPWESVHLFWGDERCVAEEDLRNNAFSARKAFIDQVPIPVIQVYPIKSDMTPSDAAADYEVKLRLFFEGTGPVFDLVLLGLGDDGHTASLFPGTACYPENKWVVVTSKAGEQIKRISLTPAVINMASKVIFLVSGKNKAAILKEVLYDPPDPLRLPAQFIRLSADRLIWFVDKDACPPDFLQLQPV